MQLLTGRQCITSQEYIKREEFNVILEFFFLPERKDKTKDDFTSISFLRNVYSKHARKILKKVNSAKNHPEEI